MAVQPVVNAGSWLVAVEAVRAAATLELYETHPGGGQYDCLALVGDGVRLEINRFGSIHVLEGHRGEAVPLLGHDAWTRQATEPGGASHVARNLLEAAGLPWPARRAPSTPRVLTYRVIARLLAARVLDIPAWDVRCQFVDTSGGLGGGIEEPVPSAEMALLPANRVWRVLHDGRVVAWLWDGWAWTAGGERRDLMAEYARGASLDQLVGIVTATSIARHAPRLPTFPDLPAQPTGFEEGPP